MMLYRHYLSNQEVTGMLLTGESLSNEVTPLGNTDSEMSQLHISHIDIDRSPKWKKFAIVSTPFSGI
jgi:hypothetical protein